MRVRDLIKELHAYDDDCLVTMRMFGDCYTIAELMFNTDGDAKYCDLIGESEWGEEE